MNITMTEYELELVLTALTIADRDTLEFYSKLSADDIQLFVDRLEKEAE